MAAAWFGCQVSVDEVTNEQTWAAMTPGGQTPRPDTPDQPCGYYEYLPDDYPTGTSFPLIVFLHGIGERGNGSLAELPRVLKHGPPKLIEDGKEFPAIVISPQLPASYSKWEASFTTPCVAYILEHYKVDRSRVYVTGLSLGGEGTWLYAMANTGIPAALVPICGPKRTTGHGILGDMPIWVFHRIGDPTVPISSSQNILEEITGVKPDVTGQAGKTGYFQPSAWNWRAGDAAPGPGENPTFTVYAGSGHDAWTAAYNNQAMWDWLFAQRRTSSITVFQQDFQSSTSLSSYEAPTTPDIGQFNDIGGQPNSGTYSINGGRLRLVRTGSSSDNDAAITRWTDLAGPPAVLHAAFDVGVSGWTATPYQSDAMMFNVGRIDGFLPYDSWGATNRSFQSISVKGKGPGQFSVTASGIESAPLAANGALHHVNLFLNKSGAAANYRGPDGVVRSLQNNGVALWVNGAAVVANGPHRTAPRAP